MRLLLTTVCHRRCVGCCNKDWDLGNLPVCDSYEGYSEFLLTGGEPLLFPKIVFETVKAIRKQSKSPIYLYTAYNKNPLLFMVALNLVDGITLTIHSKSDVPHFSFLNSLPDYLFEGKNMRLNVFDGIDLSSHDLSLWKVKDHIKWIKDCPLPENEVLMRIRD